jgi:DNA-binding response OmpR family regulator
LLEKILVVDDDPAQLRMMCTLLHANGLNAFQAGSGRDAIRMMINDKPDLVILDMAMPDMDGFETCRLIRQLSDVPVLMLTGKCKTEEDVVRGLDNGADGYIYKPVGNQELLARVKTALRRPDKTSGGKNNKKAFFSNDYLTVNIPERKIMVNGERVRLTPREFRLMALRVENADRILSHKQVLENVWGFEYVDDIDYVRIYVNHLRQKIEPEPSSPRYILTEKGIGYYFQTAN